MKIFFGLLLAVSFVFPAYANETARITRVTPVYQDNYVVRSGTRCYDVRVPVYRTKTYHDGSNILGGMIVGGLIGRGITGSDEGTAIGAIIGGVAAPGSTRNTYVGERIESRCERTENLVNEPYVIFYDIEYMWRNRTYSQRVTDKYNVGDTVNVRPSL